jgi:NAD kinase
MWESIIEWLNQNWTPFIATLGVGGGGLLVTLGNLSKAKLNLNVSSVMGKLTSLEGVVVQRIEKISKIVYDKLEAFEERMKIQEKENNTLKQENVMLANLVVEALSIANVPLQGKEKFYAGLNDISIINQKIAETLKATIDMSKIAKEQDLAKTKENIDKLSGV